MAGSEPLIEWYLAREGTQHGPLSDSEMRKFVELGHLRPGDLVWRAGFPDWRPGAQAFPELSAPAAAAKPQPQSQPLARPQPQQQFQPQVQAQPQPAVGAEPSYVSEPAAPIVDAAPVRGAAPEPARSEAARSLHGAPAAFQRGGGQGMAPAGAPFGAFGAPVARPDQASLAQVVAAQAGHPLQAEPQPNLSGLRPVGPLQTRLDTLRQPGQAPGPAAASSPAFEPGFAQGAGQGPAGPNAQSSEFDDFDEPPPRRARRPGLPLARFATYAAGALILLGGGWIGWQNRSALSGVSSIGGAVMARISSSAPSETYQAAPFVAEGESKEEIDRSLQKTALWRLLKRDYADWYAERLVDIERMRGQKSDERAISKFLADVVVVQRRKTASLALSSSPDHLRQMAAGFLGNLKQLASRDAQTCFGFISFGEASPYMLELTKTGAFAESMQRQLTAIFDAVADGRKSPRAYGNTRRTDYDVLTAELTARGWTQDDLVTFSDPRRLSSSPPDQVCRMVQDWFTVHLSLKDPELQSRLLAESLKPLVHG